MKIENIQRRHVKDVVQLLEKFYVVVPIGFNSLLVPAVLVDDVAIVPVVKGNFPRPATLTLQPAQPAYLPKAITTIPPLQMLATGVVIRRLYVLHGIPIGFWPQLIAHFYTENIFFKIVKDAIKRALQPNVDPGDGFAPKWHYSKRSIWLVIDNKTILAIGSVGRDYMNMRQNVQHGEIDLASFHFINDESEWEKSDFKFYSGVLVEVNDFVFVSSNSQQVIDCTPDIYQHTTKLLAFAVETVDSLLSEVFHRASTYDDSSWLKELIPCPLCLGDQQLADHINGEDDQDGNPVNCCSRHRTVRDLSHEKNLVYYFTVNHCLVKASHDQRVSCPKHGYLILECLAPDLVCYFCIIVLVNNIIF